MEITSTEAQNNFGLYLKLAAYEDIIVTKNGRKAVVIKSYKDTDKLYVSEHPKGYNNKITYEEFIKLADSSDNRYEYIDGEVFIIPSPSFKHQSVVLEITSIMYQWFNGKKCKPLTSPFVVTLRRFKSENNINVVQPDVLVICDTEKINKNGKYTGVPSLVVEVLPETDISRDMVKKLDLYSESGIEEYWIVNPFNRQMYLYSFKNFNIQQFHVYKETDIVESILFHGLKVPLEQVFPPLGK